jgi:hypothetical protein
MFLIEFLETVAKETETMQKVNIFNKSFRTENVSISSIALGAFSYLLLFFTNIFCYTSFHPILSFA